jgi:hypothetical protein
VLTALRQELERKQNEELQGTHYNHTLPQRPDTPSIVALLPDPSLNSRDICG